MKGKRIHMADRYSSTWIILKDIFEMGESTLSACVCFDYRYNADRVVV